MFIGGVLGDMSQKSKSVTGGFGERVLERVVARDTFLPGEVQDVVFSEVVEYYDGSITSGVKHSSPLSVYKRWDKEYDRDVRSVGVDPSVFLKVYVSEIGKRVLVEMSPSDIVKFGEFTSLNGSFKLTETDVEVKIDAESVQFEDYGSFSRAEDVTDTRAYSSFSSRSTIGKIFDKSHKCGREIEGALREAWAKQEGVYSGRWEVVNVDDFEYSKNASIEVSPGPDYRNLQFTLSMDEWDENKSMRKLVDTVGSGLVENLEHEYVWVSMSEYSSKEPVAEDGAWKLYCPSQKPNIVSRLVNKHF